MSFVVACIIAFVVAITIGVAALWPDSGEAGKGPGGMNFRVGLGVLCYCVAAGSASGGAIRLAMLAVEHWGW